MKRLLRTHTETDHTTYEDLIYLAALNTEDALLTGGATPGKDYTLLDLYRISAPLALHMINNAEKATYVCGYPKDHPWHKD